MILLMEKCFPCLLSEFDNSQPIPSLLDHHSGASSESQATKCVPPKRTNTVVFHASISTFAPRASRLIEASLLFIPTHTPFFPSFAFSKVGFLAILSNWRSSNTHRPFRFKFPGLNLRVHFRPLFSRAYPYPTYNFADKESELT